MGFMEYFTDWEVSSATFYSVVDSAIDDITGIPTGEARTLLGTVDVGKWVNTSIEANVNSKFTNNEVGKIALDYPSFTVTTKCVAVIGGIDYFIEGVDNIGSLNEVLLLTYRKDRV